MTHRLEASAAFQRLALAFAIGLIVCEFAIFFLAWNLGMFVDPGADRRTAALLVLLGTVLTLQAMGVVGIGWLVVAVSRTTLDFGPEGLALEHPWRRWHGSWQDVSSAWHRRGWLSIYTARRLRGWHVRAADSEPLVAEFRKHLRPGSWLEGSELRAHLVKRIMPLWLAAAAFGLLVLWLMLLALRSRFLHD